MRDEADVPAEDMDLASVMHALADPSRLRMIAALATTPELSCAALGEQAGTGLAKSTTTHHLGVMRGAGLISTRHEGQRKLARLRRAEVDSRFPGLLDAVIAGVGDA
jgi:DNA-binding transcriptional ArsR family regulator